MDETLKLFESDCANKNGWRSKIHVKEKSRTKWDDVMINNLKLLGRCLIWKKSTYRVGILKDERLDMRWDISNRRPRNKRWISRLINMSTIKYNC